MNHLNQFRNPVLSFETAERLLMIDSQKGTNGVVQELKTLKIPGIIERAVEWKGGGPAALFCGNMRCPILPTLHQSGADRSFTV
jgi:hypothetical protein